MLWRYIDISNRISVVEILVYCSLVTKYQESVATLSSFEPAELMNWTCFTGPGIKYLEVDFVSSGPIAIRSSAFREGYPW